MTNRPLKDKNTTVLLAVLLGSFGAHKFYHKQYGVGALMLLFSWTFIPAAIGIVEGVHVYSMSDEKYFLYCNGELKTPTVFKVLAGFGAVMLMGAGMQAMEKREKAEEQAQAEDEKAQRLENLPNELNGIENNIVENSNMEKAGEALTELEEIFPGNSAIAQARESYAITGINRSVNTAEAIIARDDITTEEVDEAAKKVSEAYSYAEGVENDLPVNPLTKNVRHDIAEHRIAASDKALDTLEPYCKSKDWREKHSEVNEVSATVSMLSAERIKQLKDEDYELWGRAGATHVRLARLQACFQIWTGDALRKNKDWTGAESSYQMANSFLSIPLDLGYVEEDGLTRDFRRISKQAKDRLVSVEAKANEERRKEQVAKERSELLSNRSEVFSAWFACQWYVENNLLRSPRSAKFPSRADATRIADDGTWLVVGYVDAHNAFGTSIRTRFICSLIRTGEESFRVIEAVTE